MKIDSVTKVIPDPYALVVYQSVDFKVTEYGQVWTYTKFGEWELCSESDLQYGVYAAIKDAGLKVLQTAKGVE